MPRTRRWDEKISPKPDRTKSKTKDGDGRFNLIKTEIIYKNNTMNFKLRLSELLQYVKCECLQ